MWVQLATAGGTSVRTEETTAAAATAERRAFVDVFMLSLLLF
jgi:hypothetical protein